MKSLEDVNILVVGDIMMDKYIIGDVHRISPEAPVPVVNVVDGYEVLGGCGNVANNISILGCKISCLASIGNDIAGERVLELLSENNIDTSFITKSSQMTTIKERIVAGERQTQMLRIDRERVYLIDPKFLIDNIYNIRERKFDYIVISDYAKGFITYQLVYTLKMLKVPIIVDPKPRNISYYSDVFMITPNKKEFEEIFCGKEYADYTLVTLGKDGMELYDRTGHREEIKNTPVDVYNVSGAGDVVVATVSVALSQGYSPLESAKSGAPLASTDIEFLKV
jgi:D-beta-D-heptose 7-phosphate kinase/D-beta-D-heptose 1-phosphate adenosyltransferase